MAFNKFLSAFILSMILLIESAAAKDLGVYGTTYKIEEIDLLDQIENKLKSLQKNGKLEEHNQVILKRVKDSIAEPNAVKGISKASKYRSFYYDPSLTVKKTIQDHLGNVIAKEGQKINPLHEVSLSTNLLFVDGNDAQQISWIKKEPGMIILVSGAPSEVEKKTQRQVYFDQAGKMTKKFRIKHVPAKVSQKKDRLFIEEFDLGVNR